MQENQVLSELSSAEPLDQRHLQAVVALQALTAARTQPQAQAVANLQRGAESAATLLLSAMRDPHAPVASRFRAPKALGTV